MSSRNSYVRISGDCGRGSATAIDTVTAHEIRHKSGTGGGPDECIKLMIVHERIDALVRSEFSVFCNCITVSFVVQGTLRLRLFHQLLAEIRHFFRCMLLVKSDAIFERPDIAAPCCEIAGESRLKFIEQGGHL